VRGEKVAATDYLRYIDGSSPRAWGKVDGSEHVSVAHGIIPTCVGKSLSE